MAEKAAGSGGFTLEVPVDASAISSDDREQQNLKIVVKSHEGQLWSQPVKLRGDGSGSARFSFREGPGPLEVFVGPDRAEDHELAASQTITTVVPRSGRITRSPVAVSSSARRQCSMLVSPTA